MNKEDSFFNKILGKKSKENERQYQLVLCTQSNWRKKIFDEVGLKYQAYSANGEDNCKAKNKNLENNPARYSEILAEGKVDEIALLRKFQNPKKNYILIGLDTITVFHDKIYGKPKSYEEAWGFLKNFSGNTVEVYTGICMRRMKDKKNILEYSKTSVTFEKITDEDIKLYLQTQDNIFNVNAFNTDTLLRCYLAEIVGTYDNIKGAPVSEVYKLLRNEFGISFKDLKENESFRKILKKI